MIRSSPRFKALLIRLIAAQACYYMIVSIDLTLTGLVGLSLAPIPALVTLPLSLIVVVGTGCSFIAGHAAARYGYRPVMVAGSLTAIAGGLISAIAVASDSFTLFCLGTALTGGYRAVGGFLRFIASDYAPPAQRERSLALVMYGGIAAAALGPFAAVAASHAALQPYVGSCLLIAALGIVALCLALTMPPATNTASEPKQPAIEIRSQRSNPHFQQAVLVLAGSGLIMTLVMASGPLANDHAGHSSAIGASMIQWHLIGMFAPSALSALLLKRYGSFITNLLGGVVMILGCAVAIFSGSGAAMIVTLTLVGIGWNILFVSGSALLLKAYPQGRGSKLQGFSDGVTAGLSAAGSFGAAWLLHQAQWQGVNIIAVAVVAVVLVLLTLLNARRREPHPTLAPTPNAEVVG
ncbi:MFS transporter [Arthrobacter psychrolactophilus]